MLFERLIRTLPLELIGLRLDKALAKIYPQYSRAQIQAWIRGGRVQVDQTVACQTDFVLKNLCELQLDPEVDRNILAAQAEEIPLDILYADAAIIVLNKPAGLVVHPAAGNWQHTLMNGLLHCYPELKVLPRAGIVHRLDKDTSGLLVIARNLTAQTHLVRQLQARTVKRHYFAFVMGKTAEKGTIDAPIGRDPRLRIRMAVTPGGKPARTFFTRLGYQATADISLLLCKLDTGRTHQIRVHCAHQGHPLLGDTLYGHKKTWPFARQALHAYRLSLIHPESNEILDWVAQPPHDILSLAEELDLRFASALQACHENFIELYTQFT